MRDKNTRGRLSSALILLLTCLFTTACNPSNVIYDSRELTHEHSETTKGSTTAMHTETISGDNEVESLQIGNFQVYYRVYAAFPGGAYTIEINEDSILTKEYDFHPDHSNVVFAREISDEELTELIDVILENDFFNLPKEQRNDDSEPQIVGSTSVFLSITVDGLRYGSEAPVDADARRSFREICNIIEKLAEYAEPLPHEEEP